MEPPLSVEFLMDSDCVETNEDGDISTVVLRNKGKGVDPREYGSALYNPKSLMVPAGTTSPGRSDVIELVGVHRDKGITSDPQETSDSMPLPSHIALDDEDKMSWLYQLILLESFKPKPDNPTAVLISAHFKWDKRNNAGPVERENGMAKNELGPSLIYFHDDREIASFWQLGMYASCPSCIDFHYPKGMSSQTEGTTLDDPTIPQRRWFPKISPYRFTVFLTPLAIGMVKAVKSQEGSATTPITLEWINGIVISLL